MIDLHLKFVVAAAIAWIVTRAVTPANAANAHRVWLAVVASPVLWFVGDSLVPPLAYARFREGLVPASVAVVERHAQWTISIYLGVAALLLGRVAAGALSVCRLMQVTWELDAVDRAGLPVEAATRVREARLALPVTAGFFRPAILLPVNWRALSRPALEAILRHEAAHVRRRDCAVALLCAVVEALLWINPFVWLAGKQVRWFAEMACDAEAARGMNGQAYAAQLLTLAASWGNARRPLYAITAGAETNVARRLDLLLNDLERPARRRPLLPALAALLLVAMPLSATVRLGGVASSGPSTASFDAIHERNHQLRHQH